MSFWITPAAVLAAGLLISSSAAAEGASEPAPKGEDVVEDAAPKAGPETAAAEPAQSDEDGADVDNPSARLPALGYDPQRHGDRLRRRSREHQFYYRGWWYSVAWWRSTSPTQRYIGGGSRRADRPDWGRQYRRWRHPRSRYRGYVGYRYRRFR